MPHTLGQDSLCSLVGWYWALLWLWSHDLPCNQFGNWGASVNFLRIGAGLVFGVILVVWGYFMGWNERDRRT
jgi:hypothetical protein